MQNEIMVSINCITYNHENYIADAIESFLMQKTDFLYEILIHDDASTDKTPDIVRSYESKYPDLIKSTYQTENQYSKGIKVGSLNSQRAQGKYIAICEGDDYWTDSYKLQKQIDYMEKHSECSLCVHAAHRVRPDKTILKVPIRPNYYNKIFTAEEVILGDGGLFATNSMLYPATFKDLPHFYQNAPVGDYPLAIYLALQGTVYYIDEFMSAYRVGVKGSWTESMSSNIEKRIVVYTELAEMLNEINVYTEYKYNSAIKKAVLNNKFKVMFFSFFNHHFPGIAKVLIRLKRKIGR